MGSSLAFRALLVLALAAPACGPSDPSADAAADARAVSDAGADALAADAPDAFAGDPCAPLPAEATDIARYDAVVRCLREPGAASATRQAAIAAFVSAVESSGGFPILAGTRAVFVYVRSAAFDAEDDRRTEEDFAPARRNEPIAVAGDFNEWSPTALAMRHEGEGFFHATTSLAPAPAQRMRYKLVARDADGQAVWYSDPLSRRFDFDGNGRISLVRGTTTQGHLEWIRGVRAARLANTRDVTVYVPRGYEQASAATRYPVLYMHDGNNLFDPSQPNSAGASWEVDAAAEAEVGAGRARPFLVVGIPNNANRFGEYTHVQDTVGGRRVGGDGDAYGEFIVRDLKPVVDRRYRTLTGRDDTAILGSSLGGLISFYVGMRHADVFRYVGGMSSTFDWGEALGNPTVTALYAMRTDLAARPQVFYLDSGGGPATTGGCPTDGPDDSRDNYCETLEMRMTLERLGVRTYPNDPNATRIEPAGVNIYHWWEMNAPHNEAAWRARMYRVIRLFFRP